MKTIIERAHNFAYKDFDGFYTGIEKRVEASYMVGAQEQKEVILKLFDEWLIKNVNITRDEENRVALADLRKTIQKS